MKEMEEQELIRDTIKVYRDARWVWDFEEAPPHMGEPLFKCKIGSGWSDKQVNEFVDQFLSDYLNEDE